MTSRKSLQNNFGYAYRTGLRDNSLFAVLNAVFLSFFFAVTPIMIFRNNTSYDRESGEVSTLNFKELYSFQFSTSLEFTRYLIIAGLLGVGLLMGIMTFRFITGKKTVNVYYSLGIKRTKLFTAKYLSGLTLIAVSVLLPMLVSLIVNIAVLGVNKYMITAFFYLVIGMFSLVAFSYTLTALVFSAVGTIFEGMLFSGILILLPEMLFSCLQILIQKLVVGTPLGSVFTTNSAGWSGEASKLTDEFVNYNPLRYFSEGLYTYSTANKKAELTSYTTGELVAWKNPNFLPLVLWLLVTAALFMLGVFVYKRRKAEIGGFIGKNKVLNFIGTFIVAFFGFVEAYNLLEAKGMAIGIIVGVAVLAVIYTVLSLLLLRNGKQFVKDLLALPVQIAVTALIFVFFATGYFGAANRVPDTADVSYAKISAFYNDSVTGATTNNYSNYGRYSFGGLDSPSSIPTGQYETEKDIDFVRGMHEKLVEAGRTEPTVLDESYNGTRPLAVQIVYVLKNGKEVKRCYYGVSEEVLQGLQKAVETDYYKARLNKLFKDPVQKVEPPKVENGTLISGDYASYNEYQYIRSLRESTDIFVYGKALADRIPLELTDAQKQTLLDCLYQDLSKKTAENRYSTANAVGVISFEYYDETESTGGSDSVYIGNGIYAAQDMITGYDSDAETFTGFKPEYTGGTPYFYITADMTATVQFLKDAGYYTQMTAAPQITAMRVIKVAHIFRSYMSRYVQMRENFGYEFSVGSSEYGFSEFTGNDAWAGAQSSKAIYQSNDAVLMQSLYAESMPRAVVMPDDYIVVFALDNGLYSKMYVPAEKMPDSVKAAVEQNDMENMYY